MIVYTGGTFDLFHSGHARLLKRCKELAGVGQVVASLNTDEFVATYKEPPICSLEERMETVAACRWVDKVIVNTGGADSRPAILSVNPDFVVVGSDWANKDYYNQMGFTQAWLDEHRITVRFVPYTENISSSIIKARLLGRIWQ